MELAQVNIARAREPFDSSLLADFIARIEAVTRRAEAAPGFVWRRQELGCDIDGFGGDALSIITMSVWESFEALRSYVYGDDQHRAAMRRRRTWYERLEPHLALWWVAPGHQPTGTETAGRLRHLCDRGPTRDAFTFQTRFDRPASPRA